SSPTTPSSTLPPPPHPPLFPYTTLFRSRCQQEPLPASETQGHLHPVHFECSRRHGCEEALHGTRSQGQSRRVGQADQRGRGLRQACPGVFRGCRIEGQRRRLRHHFPIRQSSGRNTLRGVRSQARRRQRSRAPAERLLHF